VYFSSTSAILFNFSTTTTKQQLLKILYPSSPGWNCTRKKVAGTSHKCCDAKLSTIPRWEPVKQQMPKVLPTMVGILPNFCIVQSEWEIHTDNTTGCELTWVTNDSASIVTTTGMPDTFLSQWCQFILLGTGCTGLHNLWLDLPRGLKTQEKENTITNNICNKFKGDMQRFFTKLMKSSF